MEPQLYQKAFELGRAFCIGYAFMLGAQYAQQKTQLTRDDAEFEQKHNRDESGKFSSGEKGSSSTGEMPPSITKRRERVLNAINSARIDLSKGVNPRVVVRGVANAMRGSYISTIPQFANSPIVIGRAFVNESGKYFSDKRLTSRELKELADRQLFAYEHMEELLHRGKVSKWTHSSRHHSGSEFCTIQSKFQYQGKEIQITLDIRRTYQKEDSTHYAYNMSNTGNRGFEYKMEKLEFDSASAEMRCEALSMIVSFA